MQKLYINIFLFEKIKNRLLKCKLNTAANRETFYQITIKEKNEQLEILNKGIQAIELSDSENAKYVKFILKAKIFSIQSKTNFC